MVKSKLVTSLLLMGALALGTAPTPAQAQASANANVVINDVDLTGVNIVDGVLTAAGGTVSGTIAGQPFTTNITNFELDLVDEDGDGPAPACSVLNLQLGPIDIDLLGLHVDTSEICLNITADPTGGLLGQLLCGLTDDLLGGITQGLLGDLNNLLEDILNGVLAENQPEPSQGNGGGTAEDICDGQFEILDLAIGPVNLDLLGLMVDLDDCENGPIQVCVSADRGQGLLGDLLVGLLRGGIGGLDLGLLEDLIGILDGILDLNLNNGQLKKLTNHVSGAIKDGVISTKELDKLNKTVRQIARKG